MMEKSLFTRTRLWILPLLCSIAVVGCDTSVAPEDGATQSVEGYATDNEGYGKQAARIEGATVTAANIEANGSTHTLSATTTTNASGEYSLELTEPSPIVRVRAEADDYESSALVYMEGEENSTVQAQPINSETEAEADVYIEARSNGNETFTAADAALYVDQEIAAQIESGATTASDVAAIIVNSHEAKAAFLAESENAGQGSVDESAELKTEAFASFQTSIAGADDSNGQRSVVADFRGSVRDAYLDAGIPLELYAKAQQTAHSAVRLETRNVENSSDAHFSVRQQSKIVTAEAAAHAIEASFEAQNASESRLETLANARTQLIADLRAATTVDAMAQAASEYESTVETELAAEMNVESSAVATAQDALSDAVAALESAITLNISASANAAAHSTFYSSAESAATSSLETSENAELGGEVLALLTLQ